MVRVGIPRGLLTYQYLPMWKTFLEALGAEVVISPPTTRQTLAEGVRRMVAETCLPVKVFCGHTVALAGQCDYLFIPSIKSVEPRVYNCSKLLGLPDMMRAVVPEAPPILEADIDVNQGKRALYRAIYSLARPLTWNPWRVREATRQAMEAHRRYLQEMVREKKTPPQALGFSSPEEEAPHQLTVAIVGHPYIVHDDFITHRLLPRLKGLGVRVLVPEMALEEEMTRAMAKLDGKAYWTYEAEVVGAGAYYLDQEEVDGAIGVAAFGCGPDSLMVDLVKRYAREKKRPFLALSLDEHSGEAGLLTRLEAFLDMIERKKRKCE